MAYEEREMSGTLFREREKKSEKYPDYTGKLLLTGTTCPKCGHTAPNVLLRIVAWIKEGKKGGKYFSLAVSLPGNKTTAAAAIDDDDDEGRPW